MIKTILGFFGYCKIPVEAIQLSMVVEGFLVELKKLTYESPILSNSIQLNIEAQNTLTTFLRSGKILNNEIKNNKE